MALDVEISGGFFHVAGIRVARADPSEYVTFTPTLVSTTDPNLGSSSLTWGRYIVTPTMNDDVDLIELMAVIKFGTGSNAGNGLYVLEVPEEIQAINEAETEATVLQVVGNYQLEDDDGAAGSAFHSGSVVLSNLLSGLSPNPNVTSVLAMTTSGAGADWIAHNVPWNWADSDSLALSGRFLADRTTSTYQTGELN